MRSHFSMADGEPGQSVTQRIVRLLADHGAAVRGYLLGMVRRPDVADDLLQEVFQRAWQARDRYRDEGRERAYLLRIADRLVLDRYRRTRSEVTLDEQSWREVEPAAPGGEVDTALVRSEVSAELAAAMQCLSEPQRRVLLMRYFGELSFEEIAEALECPLGTALSHCHRGLANLRRRLPAEILET